MAKVDVRGTSSNAVECEEARALLLKWQKVDETWLAPTLAAEEAQVSRGRAGNNNNVDSVLNIFPVLASCVGLGWLVQCWNSLEGLYRTI